MSILTKINNILTKIAYFLGMTIIATMVVALSTSAITRYLSGTGYDWLIELPPVLVCWLVFPLLGPLLREGNHIQVDFISSVASLKQTKILKVLINLTALFASIKRKKSTNPQKIKAKKRYAEWERKKIGKKKS